MPLRETQWGEAVDKGMRAGQIEHARGVVGDLRPDQRIVESQPPEHAPFDASAEVHVTFDRVALSYRRAMTSAGFAIR